jgi:hypothetical protein
MSISKTTRIIAVAIAAAISVGATSTAWAAKAQESRGKTYLPGEGGCKDDSGHGWVTFGCGDWRARC